MLNRGSIEGEFNSHRIVSEFEELMIYMIELDDIYMNWLIIMREMKTRLERKGKKLWGKGRTVNW